MKHKSFPYESLPCIPFAVGRILKMPFTQDSHDQVIQP